MRMKTEKEMADSSSSTDEMYKESAWQWVCQLAYMANLYQVSGASASDSLFYHSYS